MRAFGAGIEFPRIAQGIDAVHQRVYDNLHYWPRRNTEKLRDSLCRQILPIQRALRQALPGYPRGLR